MNNTKARDCFSDRVRSSLLGPGAENELWVLENLEEEIISDYPLLRYYTGVLYPDQCEDAEKDEADSEDSIEDEEDITSNGDALENIDPENVDKEDEDQDNVLNIGQNNFFPSSCGITICVDDSTTEVKADVSFGCYYMPKQSEIKIKVSEEGYRSFIDNVDFPLKKELVYNDGYISLNRELKGDRRGSRSSGDFAALYNFQRSEAYLDSQVKYFYPLLQKLYGRTWKRKNISLQVALPLIDNHNGIVIYSAQINKLHSIEVKLFTKRYTHKGNTYFKVLLANSSSPQSKHRFTSQTDELNCKALFQSAVKLTANGIMPYRSMGYINPLDEEANTLNFLYRKVSSYGIGHNCSVSWDVDFESAPKEVWTTFFPEYQTKDVRNQFSIDDFDNAAEFEELNKTLDIHSLSHYTNDKGKTISNLKLFVQQYEKWIKKQAIESNGVNSEYSDIAKNIVTNLQQNLTRLYSNIELLNDDKVYRAFSLANSAMLIQIIISNDEAFAKREKLLKEFDDYSSPYREIDYFDTYPQRKNFAPKYRPFQLAFLLLNIEAITNPDSEDRNKIVDLIWFPTGGGKTEAYLAVAAFTIIWRRVNNIVGYEGTAVIMRYTLRLLTAQQFERASRLIATLDFLRQNFVSELKDEPITIGLWVGQSSTPNTLADVDKIMSEIENEASKGINVDVESKNGFQISSCPWCGAKLVNKHKNNDAWNIDGFEYNRRKKQFYFRCPNEQCAFSEKLPIQVVDEILYNEPPTLLFATVDKFAMLAWRAEGHRFFNSLNNDGLPPDLIIQDELHLLSGALGSITGIFESVIEMLCTKNGRTPKILASTATTRNTTHQIKMLYGGREVNVFPPTGLSYDDSFFAREAKESRRKYVGFMPTGKTAVDTQLRILSNLLVARMDVYRDPVLREECFNNYWSIVSYYNSLKDVGRTNNKVGDEIHNFTQTLQKRLFGANDTYYEFNYRNLKGRVKELTSREQSAKIKQTLKDLETPISTNNIKESDNGTRYIENVCDLILATNMISVGIDISRLNVMLINGQPKNIAEYIQASSRVGRSVEGLAITLLDANRARDKSYFEHFIPFHQAFYKSVEPLSLTPFTENTIDKMLMSLAVTYVRHKVVGRNGNKDVVNFEPSDLDGFTSEMESRFGKSEYFTNKISALQTKWASLVDNSNRVIHKYEDKLDGLMCKPQSKNDENKDRVVMQSMREIDTNTFAKIYIYDPKTQRENE